MRTPALVALTLLSACGASPTPVPPEAPVSLAPSSAAVALDLVAAEAALVGKHGEAARARVHRGLAQVAARWRAEDGDAAAFQAFVVEHFVPEGEPLDVLFARLETALEAIDGYFLALGRDLRRPVDLTLGPITAVDETIAAWDAGAHVADDLFGNKLAFDVLLNFPLTTLDERLREGATWTRRRWAESRLVSRFLRRIPAAVHQANAAAQSAAGQYIAAYNVWMHHVLDPQGERLFPAGLRLLSHWNLRDQIKAEYAAGAEGLRRQRVLASVMDAIVRQTIPDAVVDNPHLDWTPATGSVAPAAVTEPDLPPAPTGRASGREPDRRYAHLLEIFRAQRLVDPYAPEAPTLPDRRFDEQRELPEARVRAILEAVLGAPEVPRVAAEVRRRLGRDLEPHDLWFNGFLPRASHDEADLDALTRRRYPDAAAFRADLPRLLTELGFDPETAAWLHDRIEVDAARGSGHAYGAARRGDLARLRTRIEKEGMNYKGYNIAVHELGHNVEQTFSLYRVDHTLLMGVPNNAFTEAMAFVFQANDLELLGLARPTAESEALRVINDFWATYEIAGVALVDMEVWRWMYAHPEATAAELREATLTIARDLWNRWYAPHFGSRDSVLLGIYSHMIDTVLYLPDYPLGHLIAFQVEGAMAREAKPSAHVGAERSPIGPAFERMARLGNIAPDLWMQQATGAPVGADALLAATREALDQLRAP